LNGYVELHADGRKTVVKRPGRRIVATQSKSTLSLQGIHYYYGRIPSFGSSTPDRTETLAVVYGSELIINPNNIPNPTQTFTGLFGQSFLDDQGDVAKVFFEDVVLPDLDLTAEFPVRGKTTASPPLEGFFINSDFNAYFYNTQAQSLTAITSPNYPYRVVGPAAWLNGRFYVMTPEGRIYASGINDPFTWSALDFINAIMHPDRGVGVFRKHTYLMAMGQNSTEWFYDSGAAIGNPLRRVDSAAHDFGCFDAASAITINDTTIFAGATGLTRELGVYVLDGYVPVKVSSPFVDRILEAGDFDCLWAYPLFHNGHRFYVLNACCNNFSLVYDMDTKLWFVWTSNFVRSQTGITLTAATTASGLVEVTVSTSSSHSDSVVGTPVTIAGATQTEYNGNFVINRILTTTNYTYMLDTSTVPTTPATGTITARIYDIDQESEWTTSCAAAGKNYLTQFPKTNTYLLERDNANVYVLDAAAERDQEGFSPTDFSFIDFRVRTARTDQGNNLLKFVPRVELVGDVTHSSSSQKVLVRYTDDDYKTWSPYRTVSMNLERSRLHRQGSMRRRAYEVRHPFDNVDFLLRL
ncbi:MAG: hypothetical protein L0Y56_17505, partial [Nitrospira sp.]|nr:hypothetical protein [Nitrospira sp.]